MPLLIKCALPFAAPPSPSEGPLSAGWALNRRLDLTLGTAAVIAQGGGIFLRSVVQTRTRITTEKCTV